MSAVQKIAMLSNNLFAGMVIKDPLVDLLHCATVMLVFLQYHSFIGSIYSDYKYTHKCEDVMVKKKAITMKNIWNTTIRLLSCFSMSHINVAAQPKALHIGKWCRLCNSTTQNATQYQAQPACLQAKDFLGCLQSR
jgi:hypothetical protein